MTISPTRLSKKEPSFLFGQFYGKNRKKISKANWLVFFSKNTSISTKMAYFSTRYGIIAQDCPVEFAQKSCVL
ncbi:MAG: hypothetical protein DDG59_01735 [Anaerolineae bacterium]|nr:MAG: hypothetical protein DDG59_01735 [Anaerolineae bacterium]